MKLWPKRTIKRVALGLAGAGIIALGVTAIALEGVGAAPMAIGGGIGMGGYMLHEAITNDRHGLFL